MYMSKLIHLVDDYDKYGIHRINAVKVVYILLLLFMFNGVFSVPRPYLYYFYVPITALNAEIMFERISDKYQAFIYTILGSAVMIFFFNILKFNGIYLLCFSFFSSLGLYFIILRKMRHLWPIMSIILSLAAYSLMYPDTSKNLNMITNNFITTILAEMVIIVALFLFPLSYYYRAWLRAFLLLLKEILTNLEAIQSKQIVTDPLIQDHTKQVLTFANMLPRRFPTFSIFKLILLVNQLHLASCVEKSQITKLSREKLQLLIDNLSLFIQAVIQERPCIGFKSCKDFRKIIITWNYICSRI
jgi:hypothetical protein